MEFEYTPIKDMPFDIKYPKDYEEWIRKTLPSNIFYDRFKKVMHCTRCGHTTEYTDMIYKGSRVVCPNCHEAQTAWPHTTPIMRAYRTYLHFWKTKNAIYYAEVWAHWEYRYSPDVIKEAVFKDYSQTREQEEHTKLTPLSFGRLTRTKQQGWERDWYYDISDPKTRAVEQHEIHLEGQSWEVYPNTERLLSKTFINMSEYKYIRHPALLIKELALHAKHPACEYIVKAGLGAYIAEKASYCGHIYIRPDWNAKTLPGFLRLKPQDVDKLRKWDQLDIEGIAYYKKILKWRARPQLEEQELVKKWIDIGALYSGRVQGDPVKLARYLQKQWEKGNWSWDTALIYRYRDYEHMLKELGYPTDDDYYRYPKDISEAHDRLVAEFNAQRRALREAEREAQRQAIAEEERRFTEDILPKLQKYNMQDGKYLIRALESLEDFKNEGINNHNCVGSYAARAMKGKAKIFVLRRIDLPDTSFVTIELALDEKSIKQCYGTGNRIPDEEVIAWVDRWLKKVVNGKNRKKRKAA